MFNDPVDCPMCGSERNHFLGELGTRANFRCADCGAVHSVHVDDVFPFPREEEDTSWVA